MKEYDRRNLIEELNNIEESKLSEITIKMLLYKTEIKDLATLEVFEKPKAPQAIKMPRKIYRDDYKEVVLGNITYTAFLHDNELLLRKQRIKCILNNIIGYRGFGRYVKPITKYETVGTLLKYVTNREDTLNDIENYNQGRIESSEIESYLIVGIERIKKESIQIRNMYTKVWDSVENLEQIKLIYSLLVLFSQYKYTRESVLFAFIRIKDFTNNIFRNSKLIDRLNKYRLVNESLITVLLQIKSVIDNSRDLSEYGEEVLGGVSDYIDFICNYTPDVDMQTEELVCPTAIAQSRIKMLKNSIKNISGMHTSDISKHLLQNLERAFENFDILNDTLFRNKFLNELNKLEYSGMGSDSATEIKVLINKLVQEMKDSIV